MNTPAVKDVEQTFIEKKFKPLFRKLGTILSNTTGQRWIWHFWNSPRRIGHKVKRAAGRRHFAWRHTIHKVCENAIQVLHEHRFKNSLGLKVRYIYIKYLQQYFWFARYNRGEEGDPSAVSAGQPGWLASAHGRRLDRGGLRLGRGEPEDLLDIDTQIVICRLSKCMPTQIFM